MEEAKLNQKDSAAKYLVRGGYVFTDATLGEKGVLQNAAVLVEGDRIVAVEDYETLRTRYPDAKTIGGEDHIVMPGIIDAHDHGRGLSFLQLGAGYDFLENALMDWPSVASISPELNAKMDAWRHLRSGCTTFHHNEGGMVNDKEAYNKFSTVLKTYRSVGVRAAFSPGIRDINFIAYDDEAFYETLPPNLQSFAKPYIFFDKDEARTAYFELFDRLYEEFTDGLTSVFFGPFWAHGSTETYLREVKERSDSLGGLPIHMHTLQTPHQRAYGYKKYGKSLLKWLDDVGIVDEHFTLGHAVYLDEEDIDLLAERRGSVTHHPSCNLSMRNGIAPVYFMQKAGVNVALGIDEKAFADDGDCIAELRMIYYINRLSGFDLANTPALTPYEVLAMGTCNAARSLGLEKEVGKLVPGMKADIITLDTESMLRDPWVSPDLDIGRAFIHRAKGQDVKNVMVNGAMVIENSACLTMDIPTLYDEVRRFVEKGQTDSQRAYGEGMRALKPYMQKWYAKILPSFPRDPFYMVNSRH